MNGRLKEESRAVVKGSFEPAMKSTHLLQVRDLNARLRSSAARVLEGISFDLAVGQSTGILGESGCGKTTLAKTLLRLLSPAIWHVSGSLQFRGTELLTTRTQQLQKIRGAQISLIPQEPELALNPVLTVGRQIDEVLRAHSNMDRKTRRKEVDSMLAAVGLPDRDVYSAYSHELSGGQRQRVVIAQSLIAKPALLIADEPTSALDNVTQAAILDLLKRLKDRLQLALLFITHNPALLSGLADRLIVMRSGCINEDDSFRQVYGNPTHSHAEMLVSTIPHTSHIVSLERKAENRIPPPPLLVAQHLSKVYVRRRGPFRAASTVVALDRVQLTIPPCSTLALVGKSGAGKSTLGRCIALLEPPNSGTICFRGKDLLTLHGRELAETRRHIQFVFQHSSTAMNPSFSVLEVVAEPLRIQGMADKKERRERALEVMEEVGISPLWADRSPLEFSGGQRQRIAISRALVLKPKLLVLDEALAGLDPGMQEQIANLLLRLQSSLSLSYLFISHDLGMAAYLSSTIAVIEQGRIIEAGDVEHIFTRPASAATRELISAIPNPARLPPQADTVH